VSRQQAGKKREQKDVRPADTDRKARRRARAQARQKLNARLGPWKKKSEAAEAEIESQEAKKAELEARMADPDLYSDQKAWSETSQEYARVERKLKRAYHRWEEAQEKIEQLTEDMEKV
jgi:ATP-binding cassette subfamily F protein 3